MRRNIKPQERSLNRDLDHPSIRGKAKAYTEERGKRSRRGFQEISDRRKKSFSVLGIVSKKIATKETVKGRRSD